MSLSRKNFFSSIFLIISLVVLSLGYLLYIQLNDLDNIKGLVLEELQKATQREVTIQKAKVSFSEGLGLELSNVVLHSKSGGKPDFTAENLWVVFRILPLVSKKVEIKKIVVKGSSIEIVRDSLGNFRLSGVQDLTTQKSKGLGKYPFLQTYIDQIVFKNGVLTFVDHMVSMASKPTVLQFQDIDLTVAKTFFKDSVRFLLTGNLSDNAGNPPNVNLTGKLKAIPDTPGMAGISIDGKVKIEEVLLQYFEPYLDKVFAFFPNDTWISGDAEISGTLDGKLNSSGKLLYSARAKTGGEAFSDPQQQSRGTIEFKNTLNKDDIIFQKLNYSSGQFNLNISGGFSDFLSDNPRVNFSVNSTAFQVNNTQSYLPFMLFHHETHQQLQSRFKDGIIEIKSLNFDGYLDQLNNLSNPQNLRLLSADLFLTEVDLGKPWPQIQKVTGSMSMNNGEGTIHIHKAQYSNFEISNLSGRIIDLINNPVVDWTLQGELNLGQLKQTLKTVMPDFSYENFLGPYKNINGKVAAVINFKGPLNSPDNLYIDGELNVDKTSFEQSHLHFPFSDIQGKILFHKISNRNIKKENDSSSPWDIRFQNFSGNFGEHSFSELGGEFTLVEDALLRKVWGKFNLGVLEATQIISDPIGGKINEILQGVSFQGGEVSLEFTSIGNPLAPKSIRNKGTIHLKNVSINHNENFQSLSNISGLVRFDGKKIQLETTQGHLGNSPIKIIADYHNSSPDPIRYKVQLFSDEFSYNDFKGVPYVDSFEYDGLAKIQINLKGRGESVSFQNEIDLSPISYKYKDLFTKPKGSSNKIHVSGRVTSKGAIFIEDLAYQLEKNKIYGKMHIKHFNNPEFTMDLNSKQLEILSLSKFFKSTINGSMGGELKFDIAGKGHLKNIEASRFRGSADLSKIVFQPQGYKSPITVSGNVQFNEKMYKFHRGKIASNRSRFILNGLYLDSETPKLKIKISGPALYLDEFMSDTDEDFKQTLYENKLFSKGSGIINVDLKRFDFDSWQLRNVVGKASFNDRKIDIPSLNIGTEKDNLIQLQGKVGIDDDGKVQFDSILLAENIRTAGFFSIFGHLFKDSLLAKLNYLKANLDASGKNWKEITNTLRGNISLDIKGGNINTALLLDGAMRLFKMKTDGESNSEEVNESSPFEKVSGDFTLINGVANTENFQYETLDRRMSLVGLFDLNKFEMDTTVGVAPLRTLDKIITKIPVVGKILMGGDEDSVFKTYYLIKGPFRGPEVTSVPLTALGKRVVGILQGILESPGDLFNPEILGEINN